MNEIVKALQDEIAAAQRLIVSQTGLPRAETGAYIKGLNVALYVISQQKTAVTKLAY